MATHAYIFPSFILKNMDVYETETRCVVLFEKKSCEEWRTRELQLIPLTFLKMRVCTAVTKQTQGLPARQRVKTGMDADVVRCFCFRHCPLALQAPLIRSVVDEMLAFCRNDPEALSFRDDSGRKLNYFLIRDRSCLVLFICIPRCTQQHFLTQ